MHRAARPAPARRLPLAGFGVVGRRTLVLTAAVLLVVTPAGCSTRGEPSPSDASVSTTRPASPPPSNAADATSAPTPEPDTSLPPADEHSAVGELPEGFPADLLPVPAGAEILVATYAPEGEAGPQLPYSVSLNVRTSAATEEVLALYRSALTSAGFIESPGTPAPSLTAETTFSRSAGEELVVVGVLDRDGVRTVTVGGRVRSPA